MRLSLSAFAALCFLGTLAACDQTALGPLLTVGSYVACEELSTKVPISVAQCETAAGDLIPIGQAIAKGLVSKKAVKP